MDKHAVSKIMLSFRPCEHLERGTQRLQNVIPWRALAGASACHVVQKCLKCFYTWHALICKPLARTEFRSKRNTGAHCTPILLANATEMTQFVATKSAAACPQASSVRRAFKRNCLASIFERCISQSFRLSSFHIVVYERIAPDAK